MSARRLTPENLSALSDLARAGGVRDWTTMELVHVHQGLENLLNDLAQADMELKSLLALINTPEIEDFDKAVPLEAVHQIERWGAQHDAGKNPEDWFWLIGYLAGKALAVFKAGDLDKAKHHCISTAAAMRNWHAHIRSGQSEMRPGISGEKQTAIDGAEVKL